LPQNKQSAILSQTKCDAFVAKRQSLSVIFCHYSGGVMHVIILVIGLFGQVGAATEFDLYLNLLREDADTRRNAVQRITGGTDTSRWAALLDVMYFKGLPQEAYAMMNRAAHVDYGRNWPRWMEWLGQKNIRPSKAYRRFKQVLFSQIDPTFSAFLNPNMPTTIRWDEIAWGGVKKDGIPSLDQPKMIPADEADWLDDDEPVFGLVINGEARAYPLRIMDWHELANITFNNGTPVALSYCTLCGAAIAYNARAGGRYFHFGTSGLLYRSNKLMYDRETHSLWSAMTGRPVSGLLAGNDTLVLQPLPVERTQWADWRRRHPQTTVLSRKTGFRRVYKRYSGYYRYFKSPKTMFPVARKDTRLPQKAIVFGAHLLGVSRAWPLSVFATRTTLRDTLAGQGVWLIGDEERQSVRLYRSGTTLFLKRNNDQLLDDKGHIWEIRENALVEQNGPGRYERLPGHLAYWFAWQAFFPGTTLYRRPQP